MATFRALRALSCRHLDTDSPDHTLLLATYSYAAAALAFAGALWRAGGGRIRPGFAVPVRMALAVTLVWSVLITALAARGYSAQARSVLLEVLRYLAWLPAMTAIAGLPPRAFFNGLNVTLLVLALVLAFVNPILAGLLLAIMGLMATEQLLRNADPADSRATKICALGVGGMFAYDLFLYSHRVLFAGLGTGVWSMRGFAFAVLLVPAMVGLRQLSRADGRARLYVSRHVVFYTTAVIAVGIYLIAAAAIAYAVRRHGGALSRVLLLPYLLGAALVLVALLTSGSPWRRLRVFLLKHFFRAKYDYRVEWRRFVGTLEGRQGEDARITAVRAIAQIIESPGGVLFLREDSRGPFRAVGRWSAADVSLPPVDGVVAADSELAGFLAAREWVIDLREYRESPAIYQHMALPDWTLQPDAGWRIVSPLFENDEMLGFVVLLAPPEPFTMIFEDRDLLRMVGRHVSTLLVQQAAEHRLAEARQFEAFSQFVAFVMHDLKNSVAQLQLLVGNAAKHRHNPRFIDDAFETIENTVTRITRLIEQLHARDLPARSTPVDLSTVVRDALARARVRSPAPQAGELVSSVQVMADPERLGSALDHVIRNAQDAAGFGGNVRVDLAVDGPEVVIEVRDTGPGMDADFIRERLFRPFDSTKGSKGMGIGAYQVREYVRQIGGNVEVRSAPGSGTSFIIKLPTCQIDQIRS